MPDLPRALVPQACDNVYPCRCVRAKCDRAQPMVHEGPAQAPVRVTAWLTGRRAQAARLYDLTSGGGLEGFLKRFPLMRDFVTPDASLS
jgi:hypothetical protein